MISEMNASKDLVTNLTMFAPSSEATNGLQRTMYGFGPFEKMRLKCNDSDVRVYAANEMPMWH